MKEFLQEDQPKKHCWRLKDHLSRNRIPFEESRIGNAFTIVVYSPQTTSAVRGNSTLENEQQQIRVPYPF